MRDDREYRILETLAEDGPLRVSEIVQKVEDHPISVERTCTRLHNGGHISSCSLGYYRVTEDGRQRLTDTHNRTNEA